MEPADGGLVVWYEPRLDIFSVSAADGDGSDLKMTHGWSEAPDNPVLFRHP